MRRIRRNRIIAGVGSVIGVALVAGGALLLMNMTDASDELKAIEDVSVTTFIASQATAAQVKPSASLADRSITEVNTTSEAASGTVSPETEGASVSAERLRKYIHLYYTHLIIFLYIANGIFIKLNMSSFLYLQL